jgi:hypothetical protein
MMGHRFEPPELLIHPNLRIIRGSTISDDECIVGGGGRRHTKIIHIIYI